MPGYGRVTDGWALMESFKERTLGFSDSVKFLGTKMDTRMVTIGL